MNEHLISVIIPVYNTAEYLPRCLDSILNNTYKNLEIICVNDGSRDDSLDVLNAYATRDSRIRVIDQENAGVSAARNRGLDEADGEYIAFVDSDDWVHRQYFEILLTCALHHDADIAACRDRNVSSTVTDAEEDIHAQKVSMLFDVQRCEFSYVIWGRLYKASVIGSMRFDRLIRLSEDTLFNLHLIHSMPQLRLVHCDSMLYYYYMRDDSAIHTLEPRENAELIKWYLSHLDTAPSIQVRNYYLEKATKHLFVWRYHADICGDSADLERIVPMIKQCVNALRAPDSNPIRNRPVYLFFARFPSAYRMFRIIHDPTMLGWEKKLRARRAAQNTNY